MNIKDYITSEIKIDVKQSLFSGQTFLWDIVSTDAEYYLSVIKNIPVIIQQISDYKIEIQSDSIVIDSALITDFIKSYFSFEIDANLIFQDDFKRFNSEIYSLISSYFSLRILRQDPYETMISFMCAQGIGMHLIRKQIRMLKKNYGKKISITLSGKEVILYTFPTPERLAAVDPLVLSTCTNNNRIRAKNIVLAAQGVADGEIDLQSLCDPAIPLAELRNTLCLNPGIGFKIADCIALFGLGRFDAFPIDTHVRQYLGKWFNSRTALRSLTPANYLILDAEARTFLNPELAGYGGHILFHCWRKEVKKLHSF